MREDIQVNVNGQAPDAGIPRPIRLVMTGRYGDSTVKALSKDEALELAADLIRKATGQAKD